MSKYHHILVHGFNVTDPDSSTGKLVNYLDDTFMFNYGWRGLLSVIALNNRDAGVLKGHINDQLDQPKPVCVIAHSNGCAIAVESARQGANIDTLVCINPALKADLKFPSNIKRVLVIHTKHDKPTKAARFFDAIPLIGLFIPNAWGAMGAYGSKSDQSFVDNWDLSFGLYGHSAFFEDENLHYYMPELIKWLDLD